MHNLYTMLHMASRGYVDPSTWRDSRRAGDRMLAYRCFDSSVDRADPRIDVDALRRYCGNDCVFSRGFPGFLWLLGWASRGDRDLRARFILILNGEERPLGELLAEHWPDASFDV